MTDIIYNWKRFWCPREGSINLSDGGYLFDPDSEHGHIINPDVKPFESIANIQCLILLGEPGIGKTFAMDSIRKDVDKEVEKEGNQTLWLNLRSYGSEDRLINDLFRNTKFTAWLSGQYQLHLFLDSLDECLLQIKELASLLVEESKKYPTERLYLRIACRTAEWPENLEQGLRQQWGDDTTEAYELTPLRKKDVFEAAKVNGLDADTFFGEIDKKEVVPLAIKPVTLTFLLNLYSKNKQFPKTQTELYYEGCRLLCEEISESRRGANLMGDFNADQHLAVASRVAAITIFANRYTIWTDIDKGDIPKEDITVRELYGGKENVDGVQFEVNEDALRETLATGLFSSRGANRLGWAHHTYAEFLAAQYLIQNEMTLVQMMSLLVHPDDPEGKLVPQLHETAAWLADMQPEVFNTIMRHDPSVLLRSDVATVGDKSKETLVETLLKLFNEGKLHDRDLQLKNRYKKLTHPILTNQLREYICDESKSIVARRAAIEIAEECELHDLQDGLVGIVLDENQQLPVRVTAAYCLVHIADDTAKAMLKPLIFGNVGDDPEDQLKGCGLLALWPNHITARELFTALTPMKRPMFIGAYDRFLSSNPINHLQLTDIPIALEWVERQGTRHYLPHIPEELIDTIVLKGWENLEIQGVLYAFVKVAKFYLSEHDVIVSGKRASSFKRQLIHDNRKRRLILQKIVPILENPEKDSLMLAYSQTPLVLTRDLPWIIECLLATQSDREKTTWAYLVIQVFNWRNSDNLHRILKVRKYVPILAKEFPLVKVLVALYMPSLFRLYLWLRRRQFEHRFRPRLPKKVPLKPPLRKRMTTLLNRLESGDYSAWWHLNLQMTLDPEGTKQGNELECKLKNLPGWKIVDAATEARIVAAAKQYVLNVEPRPVKWVGTNVIYRPDFAGYRAFRLLLQEDSASIDSLPPEVWKRWAPVILAYPAINDEEPHLQLVKKAYYYAAEDIIDTLMLLIDVDNKSFDHIFITRCVKYCWDDNLTKALLKKVGEDTLKPECMGCLLSNLLDHDVKEARAFAESLVPLPPPASGERQSRAIVAARTLMNHTKDVGWPVVWPAIQEDVNFGRALIESVAHGVERYTNSIAQRLNEDQLAELYIWLVQQYPPDEDPKINGTHAVTPRETVADFRNLILDHLAHRGTIQTCEALLKIVNEFPTLEWLKWWLLDAQNITRRNTWYPPKPKDILDIAANSQARLVQDGNQLLDVLLGSLKRLENRLQGETPESQFLWNEIKKDGICQPKDENSFSDYAKKHLEEDLRNKGIIVNREVRIHRGESTDIHVDAVTQQSTTGELDSITVIIEVKGCWRRELNQAMKTQLVDRYLQDNHCHHGIYLVGWFNCDHWDDGDYRKKQVLNISKDEAQKQFDNQAASLSQHVTQIRAFVIDAALK